jgi:hypothetical protein
VSHGSFGKRRHASHRRSQKPPRITAPIDGIQDYWDLPGFKLPGNPKITLHAPVDIIINDVRGFRVCVARRKYQALRNTGTAPDACWLWRPNVCEELWLGPHHHHLTHALRLLQACSRVFDGKRERPQDRQLRGSIEPNQLLQQCGVASGLASELVFQLVELQLLRAEPGDQGMRWLVNSLTRGVNQSNQLLGSNEVPEYILPEFMAPPLAVSAHSACIDHVKPEPLQPDEIQEECPQIEPPLDADERVKMNGNVIALSHEQVPTSLLTQVYRHLCELVPETAEKEGDLSIFSAGVVPYLEAKLNLSGAQVHRQLQQLKVAGIYRTTRGVHAKRYLKLNAEDEVATLASSNGHAANAAALAKPASDDEQRQVAPPDAVVPTPEQMNRFWAQLEAKLQELEDDKAKLEKDLTREREAHAQTRQDLEAATVELEEAKQAQTTIVVPPSLARFLEPKGSD